MTARKLTILTLVLWCAAPFAFAGEDETTTAVQQSACCFENPRYSGTCEVTPGEDESCGSILSYLNNPNSMGKGYCGNTNIRGGWSQVACETSAATAGQCGSERPDQGE